MKLLLSRTNLWLWFILAVPVVAQLAFIATTSEAWQSNNDRLHGLVTVEIADMTRAYEIGGAPELASEIAKLDSILKTQAYLLDSQGRDLTNGSDRTDLLRMNAQHKSVPPWNEHPMVFKNDGTYTLVLIVPKSRREIFLLRSFMIMGPVLAVCLVFAWLFAVRIRRLEKTVEKFSGGDLSARVGWSSDDGIGRVCKTFDEMADRIQVLLQSERQLFMDLSHELRSPLTRLAVALKLARSGKDPNIALDRVQKECTRLNYLITDLLQLAHAEVDPHARVSEQIDLKSLISEIADGCVIEAEEQDCHLRLELDDGPSLSGDPEILHRAIENLIRNAIRHSPAESYVEIGLRAQSEQFLISVRDYGPGVPDAALEDIFRPFYRISNGRERETGGVGLGLAIAKRAIALHGGSIQAKNSHPGLSVVIELPFASKLYQLNPESRAEQAEFRQNTARP